MDTAAARQSMNLAVWFYPMLPSVGGNNLVWPLKRFTRPDLATLSDGVEFLRQRPIVQDRESLGTRDIRPETPTVPFRFFSLPPEIRQEIIRFSVTDPGPIFIKFKPFNRHTKSQRKTRSGHLIDCKEYVSSEKRKWGYSRMALLFTCRQAYMEGFPRYYGDNIFNFTPEVLTQFCDEIPPHCLQQIRHIIMPFLQNRLNIWHLLAKLKGLHTLHLAISPILRNIQPSQMEQCRKEVEKLPQLRVFRVDRVWHLAQFSTHPLEGDRHQGLDPVVSIAENEINAYLSSRR